MKWDIANIKYDFFSRRETNFPYLFVDFDFLQIK